jgi:hypothetical protein
VPSNSTKALLNPTKSVEHFNSPSYFSFFQNIDGTNMSWISKQKYNSYYAQDLIIENVNREDRPFGCLLVSPFAYAVSRAKAPTPYKFKHNNLTQLQPKKKCDPSCHYKILIHEKCGQPVIVGHYEVLTTKI